MLASEQERDVVSRRTLAQAGMLVGELLLSRRGVTTKATVPQAPAYATTRRAYYGEVKSAVGDYLQSGDRSVTKYRNRLGRAILNSFSDAFYRGYSDGGGVETETDDDQWLTDRQNAEIGFAGDLFITLRDGRDSIPNGDLEAVNRAEGYTATLDGVYSEGKLRGGRNRTLVFSGDDGKENCSTCKRLKGKRRSTKWILENDMIPYPGNPNFECLAYQCQHYWADAKTGDRVTL